ncbi:GNAT family N-acetyltransferase [Streptomyces krungchingensis]
MDVSTEVATTVYPGEAALAVVDEFVHLRQIAARERPQEQDESQPRALRRRLAEDARVPGFLAVTARIGSRLCGFGTAMRCADPYPGHAALDVGRAQEWLAGAVQVTDLVVAPVARGRGVGTRLLDVLLLPALDDRAWAAVDGDDRVAVNFFRTQDWRQSVVPSPRDSEAAGQIVFLAPRHPALNTTHELSPR